MKRFRKHIRKKTILVGISLCILIAGGVAVGLSLLHPKGADAAWYSSTWNKRKKITIDHTKVNGSSALTNFPVLINVTDPNIKANAQSDGDDILFTSADGATKLNHEIETYFPATGQVVAWVQVPSLSPSVDTVLYMYYGNTAATNQESIAATWDTDYAGVYHFAEVPQNGVQTQLNSENNTNQGQTQGSWGASDQITGKIGLALDFDAGAENDRVELVDNHSGNTITLSGWVKADTINSSGWHTLFQRTDSGGTWFDFQLYIQSDDGTPADRSVMRIDFDNDNANDTNEEADGGITLSTGTWYYLAATYDGSALRFYRDGTLIESTTCVGCTIPDSNNNIYVGENSVWDEDIDGQIDEIRVSNTYRSTEWIATEYANQYSPDTFYSYGTEEAQPSTVTAGEQPVLYWNGDEGYGTTVNDASGNGNSGTRTNAVWQTEDACVSGRCLFFDGSGDYVSRAADADLDIAASDSITLGGWFRHEPKTSGSEVLIARHHTTGADGGFKIIMESDGDITCGFDRDSTYSPEDSVTSTAATYDDNQWHHFSCVKSGSTSLTLYIDGVSVGSPDVSIASTGTYANADIFYVGIDGDGSANAFTGFLDEIKIYRYARTAAQVVADTQRISGSRGVAAVMGAADSSALSDGLVGYWKMDNNVSGNGQTITDTSGAGNTGTTNYGANTSGMNCTVAGKFSLGCTFDNVDDVIDIASNTDFAVNSEITVAAWVNHTGNGGDDRIFDLTNNNNGYALQVSSTGRVSFLIGDGAAYSELQSASTLDTGTWHHVVGTFKNGVQRVYIDGQLDNSQAGITFGLVSGRAPDIGARGTANTFYGTLDELRVYTKALSDSEVELLYQWAPGPAGYWNMNENTGTSSLLDISGTGNNGVLNKWSQRNWIVGKFGGAIRSDSASGSYVRVTDPSNGSLDVGTGEVTVMGWFRSTDTAYTHPVDKKFHGSYAYGYQIRHEGTGGYVFRISNNVDTTWATPNATGTEDGQWHHIAGVREKSGSNDILRIYKDGVLVGSSTTATGTLNIDTTQDFTIGGDPVGGIFNGDIDDVKVYTYARSAKQIVEDMNAGHPAGGSPIASQIINWNFDERYGATVNNANTSQLGLTGTITGAKWLSDTHCKYNGCLYFDTGTDGVSAGDVDFVDGLSQMTLSMWVYPVSLTTARSFISKYNGTNQNVFAIGSDISASDELLFGISTTLASAATGITTTDFNLEPGKWTHIVGVYDGSLANEDRLKIYKNGVRKNGTVGGTITTSLPASSTSIFSVGESAAGAATAPNAYFDDVKIYTTALTEDQIKLDMNANAALNFSTGTLEASKSADAAGNGPVAWWKFDENTGVVGNDATGNGNSATMTQTTWKTGKTGSAAGFNGTNSYVSVNDNPLFTPAALTVSAWVKFNQLATVKGDDEWIITHDHSTDPYDTFLLYLQSANDTFAVTMSNSVLSGTYVQGTTTVVPGRWYHVGFIYNGTTLKLYVDGIEEGSVNFSGTVFDGDGNLSIGAEVGGFGGNTDGAIDDVRLYNYARTPAQFIYDYNRGAPLAWWKLDECTGATAYDSAKLGSGEAAASNGTITPSAGSNTSTGTCGSGTSSEMWNDGTTGKRNGSLGFDGSDDTVSVGNLTRVQMERTDLRSYTFWMKTVADGSMSIITKQANSAPYAGYNIQTGSGGYLYYQLVNSYSSNTLEVRTTRDTNFDDGSWHFVSITYDGTSTPGGVKIYFDGNSEALTTTVNTLSSSIATSTGLQLGSRAGAAQFFNGQLDDVRMFNYVLSAAQIKNIMQGEGGGARFGPGTGSP